MSSAGWKDIKYRQDLPPPGGYESIPYKRNIPIRGPSGAVMLGLLVAIHGLGLWCHHKKADYGYLKSQENHSAELCMEPLLDAERDRANLRNWKETVESEALNIVGTGFDPDFKPGATGAFSTDRYHDTIMTGPSMLLSRIQNWYHMNGIPRCGP